MDLINYSQDTFNEISKEITKMITKHYIYYKSLKILIIPVAAMDEKDNNLIEFSDKMNYAPSTLK